MGFGPPSGGLRKALPGAVVALSVSFALHAQTTGSVPTGEHLSAVQILHRHLEASPRSLDPSLANDVPSQYPIEDLFEGLVALDPSGKVTPGIARSWEMSADGKTWTFYLRRDARWSDGHPVTATDFTYAWQRILDPALGAEYAQGLIAIVNAMEINQGKLAADKLGVETPDPYTLVVHLNAPTGYFLELLTNQYFAPLPRWTIEKWGDAWTHAGHMVSDGAFKLEEAVINGRIRMLRNPDYWDAANVRLQEVDYIPLEDTYAATAQYLAGNIDFTDRFAMGDVDRLRAQLGDQVHTWPYFGTVMFGFNLDKPPFKGNLKLRQALNMAIDREIIAKYVNHDVVQATTHLMPKLEGYNEPQPSWAALSDDDRHAKARELYKEAGYDDRHPLHVLLSYPTSGADQRRSIEALSAMWRMNLGADVQIYNQQFKVLLQNLQMHQPLFFWNSWIGDYPDPYTYLQLFTKGFPQNYGDYDNPRYDALLDQAQNTADRAERFGLLAQAEQLVVDDSAICPVYFYSGTHLIKPYVKGWASNIDNRNYSKYMYLVDLPGAEPRS